MNSTQHMQFHDVANIFPMMGDEEYRALVADIKANGLHQPIWTYQGKIIDGRNRYKACLEAGIEPQFREWNGEGSLIVFVVSLNLNRRHLTSSQKAMVAIEVEKRLAEENKVGRPAKDTEKGGNISTISGKSRDHAAAIVGTNGRYVTDAKKIVEKAPELEEVVRCGKLTIPDAKKVANLPEDLRQSVLAKVEEIHKDGPPRRDHKTWDLISEAKREERRSLLTELARRKASSKSEVHVYRSHRIYERIYCTLHKGGIEALQDNIEPASVDAIITQPPDPGNIDYDELGEFAAYALEDGGSLVIVTSSDAVR